MARGAAAAGGMDFCSSSRRLEELLDRQIVGAIAPIESETAAAFEDGASRFVDCDEQANVACKQCA